MIKLFIKENRNYTLIAISSIVGIFLYGIGCGVGHGDIFFSVGGF